MFTVYSRHSINLTKESFYTIFKIVCKENILRGRYEDIFNKTFARYIGTKYALGVSSARVGLAIVLKALGLKEGEEVILSAYNFQIIPNILKEYGIKPVFVDVNPETCNIQPDLVEDKISNKTRAIIATHMFGQPCELDKIIDICKKNNLVLIEDCAHACGSEYKGRKVGSFGGIGIFSFGFGKKMTCFGGGALTINDDTIYKKAQSIINGFPYPSEFDVLKNFLKSTIYFFLSTRWLFTILVYPFIRVLDVLSIDFLDKMLEKQDSFLTRTQIEHRFRRFANIQAAVGISQLKKLEDIIKKTETNVKIFLNSVTGIKSIKFLSNIEDVRNVYTYFMILVDDRKGLRKKLLTRHIDTNVFGTIQDCSQLQHFCQEKADFPNARIVTTKIIEIPLTNYYLQPRDIINLAKIFSNLDSMELPSL